MNAAVVLITGIFFAHIGRLIGWVVKAASAVMRIGHIAQRAGGEVRASRRDDFFTNLPVVSVNHGATYIRHGFVNGTTFVLVLKVGGILNYTVCHFVGTHIFGAGQRLKHASSVAVKHGTAVPVGVGKAAPIIVYHIYN